MRTRRWVLGILPAMAAAQVPQPPFPNVAPKVEDGERPVRLPNGKLQRDEIAKAEYQKSLEDCKQLIKVAEDLKAEMEKNEQYVLSVSSIKKTEEIEKLAKRIRGRMVRS